MDKPEHAPSFEELHLAESTARAFRARGDLIFPGRLLALRGGSLKLHAIDDDAINSPSELIVGVAIWGPIPEFRVGAVNVQIGEGCAPVPMVRLEENRPSTGIRRIDGWIARASILRRMRRGIVATFGGTLPLTQAQFLAAFGEVERVVRETAMTLLQSAPSAHRHSQLALAAVADSERPTDEEITSAIQELMLNAAQWQASEGKSFHTPQSKSTKQKPCVEKADRDGRVRQQTP